MRGQDYEGWTIHTFLFNLRFTVLVFFEVLCLFPAWPYFKSPLPVLINLFAAAFFVFVPLLITPKNGNIKPIWPCFLSTIGLASEITNDLRWFTSGTILLHCTNLLADKGTLGMTVVPNPRLLPTICFKLRIVFEKLSLPATTRENICQQSAVEIFRFQEIDWESRSVSVVAMLVSATLRRLPFANYELQMLKEDLDIMCN